MKKERKMVMVANKVNMKTYDQSFEDLNYWLSKPPIERIAAVTFLIKQFLKLGERMDKTKFNKIVLEK